MKMSPIKKIVIGLAVITVALSLITANNMASVMLIVASREAGSSAQQSVQTNQPVQNQANNSQSSSSNNNTANDNTATNTPETTAPAADNNASDNTANDNAANSDTPADNNASSDDKAPADDKGNADDKAPADKNDKAAIVAEFNKAVNSVKSKAKTVEQKGVTNYLAGQTETGGLKTIYNTLGGDSWLDGMLRDNSQGAATYTGADITAKFPVEGQTWSSKLTADDVKEANRSEKNGVITITITTIADEKSENVKVGEGHAPKAFNVVLPGVVNDNIPGIAKSLAGTASMAYPESTAKITVDAKTGNVITADYDMKWTINFDKMGVVLPFGTKAEYTVKY
ncbi:MAG: hypothetical protein IJN94_08265 [Clostridia bacterium]|nr:hypothetical protein [Clostridia bacterium]